MKRLICLFISILLFGCSQSTNMFLGVGQALDSQTPKISITSPENGIYVNKSDITITGTCSDNVGVTKIRAEAGINETASVVTEEIKFTSAREGSWSVTFDENDLDKILKLWRSGLKITFTFTCYDGAGNTTVEHLFLYVDVEQPRVIINRPEVRFSEDEKVKYENNPEIFKTDYDINKFEKISTFVNKEFILKGYVDDDYSVKSTYINIYNATKKKQVAVTPIIFKDGTFVVGGSGVHGGVTGNSQSWEFKLDSTLFCPTEGWHVLEVVTEDEAGNERRQFVDKDWIYINQNADIPKNNFTSFSPGFKLNAGNMIAGNAFDDNGMEKNGEKKCDGMKEVWVKIVPKSTPDPDTPYTEWEECESANYIVKRCADFTEGVQLGNWSVKVPSKAGDYIIYAVPVDTGDIAPATPYEDIYASYFSVASEEDPVVGIDSRFRGTTIVEKTDITGYFYDNNKVTKIEVSLKFDENEKEQNILLYDLSKSSEENEIKLGVPDNSFQLTTGQIVVKNNFKWEFDTARFDAFKVLQMTFRAEDEDGNYGEDVVTIYGDSERPSFVGEVTPANNSDVIADNVFEGKVSDNVDVVKVIIEAAGSWGKKAWECKLGEAQKDKNGKNERTFKSDSISPNDFGGYIDSEFTISAIDAAGNIANHIIFLKGNKDIPAVLFVDENGNEESSGKYATRSKVLNVRVMPVTFEGGSYREITSVSYSINGSAAKKISSFNYSPNEGYYTIEIEVSDLGENVSGDVTLQVKATDIENGVGEKVLYFIVDNDPPDELSITSPLLKDKAFITNLTDVTADISENDISYYQNQVMILKGTISDNYKISKTVLEFCKDGNESVCTIELPIDEERKHPAIMKYSGIPGNFTLEIDTTKFGDGNYLLKTTAFDAAGNSTVWGDEEDIELKDYYFKILQEADKPRFTFNVDFPDGIAQIYSGTILKGSVIDDDAVAENGVRYIISKDIELSSSDVVAKFAANDSDVKIVENIKSFTRQDWQLKEFENVGLYYLYMLAKDKGDKESGICKKQINVISTDVPHIISVTAVAGDGGESNGYYSGKTKIVVEASGGGTNLKGIMYRITSSSVTEENDLGKWNEYLLSDTSKSEVTTDFEFDSRLFAAGKTETINVEVKCVTIQGADSNPVKDKVAIDNAGPELKILSPNFGVSVNKTFEISGSGNDRGAGLKDVYISYHEKEKDPTLKLTGDNLSEEQTLGKWYKLPEDKIDGISWSADFNSEIIHAEYEEIGYTLVVAATDSLGNIGTVKHPIKINQDLDRPIVRLQNLNLSAGGTLWHKSNSIFGTISDDDSGSEGVQVYIHENGTKSDNCYKDGSWEYTFTEDGEKKLEFEIVDSEGSRFISADTDGLTVPKIVDSTGNLSNKSKITIKVDTQNPSLGEVYFNKNHTAGTDNVEPQTPGSNDDIDTDEWSNSVSDEIFGGEKNIIWILFRGSDANGIKEGSLSCIKDNSGAIITKYSQPTSNENLKYYYYKYKIDISKVKDSLLTFKVEAKDNSSLTTQKTFTVNIDNTAPTININSHSYGSTVYGTETNTIRGTSADSNNVRTIEYTLTKEAVAPTAGYTSIDNPLNWEIEFKGGDIFNNKISELYGCGQSYQEAPYDLYLWLKATDKYGNVSEPKSLYLKVLALGDKPKINIDYPEKPGADGELKILGGKITVSGTTDILTDSVKEVYIQIDPSYDGSFSETWDEELKNIAETYNETITVESTDVKGIKVTSSSKTNWRLNINNNKELSGPVAVRAIAVSKTSGKWTQSDVVVFKIDENVPQISETKLVQYDSNGNKIKTLEYIDEMWLSGTGWKFVANITDNEGIVEDSIKTNPASFSIGKETITSGYRVEIPLNTSGFGRIQFTLNAEDTSENHHPVSKNMIINYDNTPPEFAVKNLSLSDTERSQIKNSSGVCTISGTFAEDSKNGNSQSGFERIAMYFTKKVGGQIEIVDLMLQKGNGTANRYLVSEFENGMYWRSATASSINGSEISLSEIPQNVRPGGLCKVDGVIYGIEKIEGTSIIVDGKLNGGDNKNVYFALAQVIDNTISESGKTTYYDNPDSELKYDDGDQMVEGVIQSGTSCDWSVYINSENIFDGDVDIHFVAFDKAGNSTAVTCYGKVENNRPRIAGVVFGSNKDGNQNIEGKELITSFENVYDATKGMNEGRLEGVSVNGKYGLEEVYNLELPLEGNAALMTIKDSVIVKAKVVGGNRGLKWQWKIGNKAWSGLKDLSNESSFGDDIRADIAEMPISMFDLLKAEIGNLNDVILTVRIWDETEGCTAGTDSLYAEINIKVNTILVDTSSPVVTITPFYWKSKDDNSLYQNSSESGHIELEADLPTDTFKKGNSGVYDRDPKVSGKITIEGTATDNVLLNKLIVSIPDFMENITAAQLVNGTWISAGNMDTDGWACDVTTDATEQEDYKVNWKFHWDTSKISGMAKNNVVVTVKATDRGQADATLAVTENDITYKPNTSEAKTYTMDVVPYITGITTTLTALERNNPSVYGRSALGKYPIYYYRKTISDGTDSEKITIEGFNIKNGANISFAGGSGTLDSSRSISLPANAKSGQISVTVNGIESLNNKNNNGAKGNYSGSDYENYYNRQPNGQNNNILTDDVELAIWDINSKAAITEAGELSEVVMHVNPTNGMVGLAFAHSQDLASYPNGNNSSYQTWITDWTGVNQIGFVYDEKGNMFGTNGGTDTYTPNKKTGRLGLISSHWGTIATEPTSNDWYSGYTKKYRLRLEYLGITQNGAYASNVNRFAKGDCTQFATTYSEANGTNLYMLYYDNNLGELKFKAGNFGKKPATPTDSNDSTKDNLWNPSNYKFGDFADDAYNEKDSDDGINYAPNYTNISIVANQSGANGDTKVRPGIYYSVSVIASSDGKSDVVVAVWYDDKNKTLWYSYMKNPLSNAGKRNSNGAISTEWAKPVAILNGHAFGYCAIKADDDGHIHIAAYSRNDAGSLYYAYLDSYNSTFEVSKNLVAVDCYGSTGQYITMEFAKNSAGKTIPYIGYYMNSMSYPRYAYLADTGSAVAGSTYYPKAGVDDKNMYTGAWEIIMLPTTSSLVLDDINIGVYKDSDGKLIAIPTQTESAGKKNGITGGNGTANPIFGYGIVETGFGYVETAQLK